MKKQFVKIQSICLALVLVLSLALLPNAIGLNAFANATKEYDTEFVEITREYSLNQGNLQGADISNYNAEFLANDSGVKLTYIGDKSVAKREGYGNTVNVDGLTLYFNNLVSGAASDKANYTRPVIYIGDPHTDGYGPRVQGSSGRAIGFQIDTYEAKIKLVTCDGSLGKLQDLCSAQDALKYANITGKKFSVRFVSDGNQGYVMTVEVEGFSPITINVTHDTIFTGNLVEQFTNPAASYVAISQNNAISNFSIEFLGLSQSTPVSRCMEKINELSAMNDDVLLYSGNLIKEAETLYAALSDTDKALVTNYTELATVKERYKTLSATADTDLVKMDVLHTRYTGAAQAGDTSNSGIYGEIKVTNRTDNYGITFDMNRVGHPNQINPEDGLGGLNKMEAYASNVNLDGLKLQFDNFISCNNNYPAGQMAILLGNGVQGFPSFNNSLALVLNPQTGSLYALYGEGATRANIDKNIIIKDNALKGANLENRRFSVSLNEDKDSIFSDETGRHCDYTVTLEIAGKTLTGTIPYTGGLEKVTQIWASNNVTVALTLAWPYDNGGTFGYSVDWLGVGTSYVNGKDGNLTLTAENAKLSANATRSGNQIYLPAGEYVEFVVKTNALSFRAMAFGNNGTQIDVYVDNSAAPVKQFINVDTTRPLPKYRSTWCVATDTKLTYDESASSIVKIKNSGTTLVTIDAVILSTDGDVNLDGDLNYNDIDVLRKHLLGLQGIGYFGTLADANADNGIDIRDLVAIDELLKKKISIIDNSSLLNPYYATTYDNVKNAASTAINSPDWTKDMIIGIVNLRTAIPEGSLWDVNQQDKILKHYAEMGVNAIWVLPIYHAGNVGNGYSNKGINTIDPRITGQQDTEAGFAVFKDFVDRAHNQYNIRIILDVVFRGVTQDSPLCTAHPGWFTTDDEYPETYKFKWQDTTVNREIADWYKQAMLDLVNKTNCDGFRYDSMPATVAGCNIPIEKEIINYLHTNGKFPFIMSEAKNTRSGYYATESVSIREVLTTSYYTNPYNLFLGGTAYGGKTYNIVDFIKTPFDLTNFVPYNGAAARNENALSGNGGYKFCTYVLENHDYKQTLINGNRLAVGYQAMFAPFIPIMTLGTEWNNPHNSTNSADDSLYFNQIDWWRIDCAAHRYFYEDVKAMIRIRREYSDLFNLDAATIKESNIVKVATTGTANGLTAYARYKNNRAAIIVPNNNNSQANIGVTLNFNDLGLSTYNNFTVIDAETKEELFTGDKSAIGSIGIQVDAQDQRVLIVTGN